MAGAVYILCAATALLCAVLLWRGYRQNRTRLLLWSTVCFGGLTIENTLLFVDDVLVPHIDLSLIRTVIALFALILFVYGLIWDSK